MKAFIALFRASCVFLGACALLMTCEISAAYALGLNQPIHYYFRGAWIGILLVAILVSRWVGKKFPTMSRPRHAAHKESAWSGAERAWLTMTYMCFLATITLNRRLFESDAYLTMVLFVALFPSAVILCSAGQSSLVDYVLDSHDAHAEHERLHQLLWSTAVSVVLSLIVCTWTSRSYLFSFLRSNPTFSAAYLEDDIEEPVMRSTPRDKPIAERVAKTIATLLPNATPSFAFGDGIRLTNGQALIGKQVFVETRLRHWNMARVDESFHPVADAICTDLVTSKAVDLPVGITFKVDRQFDLFGVRLSDNYLCNAEQHAVRQIGRFEVVIDVS